MKTVYTVELPDSAVEVEERSFENPIALYALYDALIERDKDAILISGINLGDYPGFTCTHYAAKNASVICLCVRKERK